MIRSCREDIRRAVEPLSPGGSVILEAKKNPSPTVSAYAKDSNKKFKVRKAFGGWHCLRVE